MKKFRSSISLLAAAGVTVGAVAFILVHANQVTNLDSHHTPHIMQTTSSISHVSAATVSNYTKPTSSANNNLVKPIIGINPLPVKGKPIPFSQLKTKYNLLTIPTYDGSGQLTHPKVLYFQNGWNGYRYWMSMTPYPHTVDRYENPSIVVSNDGLNWFVPRGLKNPITGLPKDVKFGGHYSDPHLVMKGNTMELWYRHNPGNPKTKRAINSINTYYKMVSTDGIHWSAPQELFTARDGHLSMAINYENGMYKAWYATYSGNLCYQESYDSFHWSQPIVASVPLPAGYCPYHQDMIKVGSQYCLLQCAEKRSDYTFAEFFATSEDGIHFLNTKQIYPTSNTVIWKDISFYRSSMFVKDDKIEMYLTLWFKNSGRNWYLTHQSFPIKDLMAPAKDKIISNQKTKAA